MKCCSAPASVLLAVLARQLGEVLETLFHNPNAGIAFVEQRAIDAVLVPFFRIPVVSTAAFAQRVERAVAEQAVELVGVDPLMTGKMLAFPVLEKRGARFHEYPHLRT